MKKLILFFSLLLFICGTGIAQTSGEVVILRVEYAKKTGGIEHRLQLDAGSSSSHSLAGKISNEKGLVRIKTDEKTEAFANEVDLISFLQKSGFRLIHTFQQTIMGETYQVYLFERP